MTNELRNSVIPNIVAIGTLAITLFGIIVAGTAAITTQGANLTNLTAQVAEIKATSAARDAVFMSVAERLTRIEAKMNYLVPLGTPPH